MCYRRDRVGRVGGGVAIYVTDSVDSNNYNPLGDYNTFEILWVKCKINSVDCFIAGLYHPPKPLYPVPDLFNFLSCTIDSIVDNYTNSCIIIAGDCNTLSDSSFFDLGLLLSVKVPTHKGHFLDKIFVNQPLYQNVKAVRSSIKTEHAALIAKSDASTIVDVNKTRTAVTFRKPTPAKSAYFLSGAQSFDWAPVLNSSDVQAATDSFYVLANQLLDTFFPLNHVTLSSRDPPYITPTIKHLLRLKNRLTRQGQVEKANALAVRIGSEIILYNSGRLKREVKDFNSKDLWSAVRDITGKNRTTATFTCVDAASFNAHY